jgi:hypothetical protein
LTQVVNVVTTGSDPEREELDDDQGLDELVELEDHTSSTDTQTICVWYCTTILSSNSRLWSLGSQWSTDYGV